MNTLICLLIGCLFQLTGQPEAETKLNDLSVITLQKDTVSLFEDAHRLHLLIFADGVSCYDCYGKLGTWLAGVEFDTSAVNVSVVCRCPPASIVRRQLYNKMKIALPSAVKIYFDFSEEDPKNGNSHHKTSVFAAIGISSIPAIVVFDKKQEKLKYNFSFGDLFSNGGMLNENVLHVLETALSNAADSLR